MTKPLALFPALALSFSGLLTACSGYSTPSAIAGAVATTPQTEGAVSAADPRAQAAGEAILAKGGSATDAAIAVMLALTVVEPQSSGIGGGGFMVRAGGGDVTTFDGRETAPATATGTRFLDADGNRLPANLRVTSGLSVGVPGNLALAAKAHQQYGQLPWAELFTPAIELAREGFVMNRRLHQSLEGRKDRAGKTQAARAIFFGDDGEPLPVGTKITVPDLADTLERIANRGADAFYDASAEAMSAYIAEQTPQDGVMAASDIQNYEAKTREAVYPQ